MSMVQSARDDNPLKISLTTSCRNRGYQLRQVFVNNMEAVISHPEIEWIIVDYGSDDSLLGELSNIADAELSCSQIKIFTVISAEKWHMSRAKNLGHRLASTDYVFNLDADNYITSGDISCIYNAAQIGALCHQFSGTYGDGSHGRIGLPKHKFMGLGGYDEGFLPMGYQDVDLLRRAKLAGIQIVQTFPPEMPAVQNSKDEKMGNCEVQPGVQYKHFNNVNLQLSDIKIKLFGARRVPDFTTYLLRNQRGEVFALDSDNQFHYMQR